MHDFVFDWHRPLAICDSPRVGWCRWWAPTPRRLRSTWWFAYLVGRELPVRAFDLTFDGCLVGTRRPMNYTLKDSPVPCHYSALKWRVVFTVSPTLGGNLIITSQQGSSRHVTLACPRAARSRSCHVAVPLSGVPAFGRRGEASGRARRSPPEYLLGRGVSLSRAGRTLKSKLVFRAGRSSCLVMMAPWRLAHVRACMGRPSSSWCWAVLDVGLLSFVDGGLGLS